MHDCSPNADCLDTPESYRCKCRDDFVDESPDRNRPGRICRPALVDECRIGKHDCDRNAICQDLPQGFTCQCFTGIYKMVHNNKKSNAFQIVGCSKKSSVHVSTETPTGVRN